MSLCFGCDICCALFGFVFACCVVCGFLFIGFKVCVSRFVLTEFGAIVLFMQVNSLVSCTSFWFDYY